MSTPSSGKDAENQKGEVLTRQTSDGSFEFIVEGSDAVEMPDDVSSPNPAEPSRPVTESTGRSRWLVAGLVAVVVIGVAAAGLFFVGGDGSATGESEEVPGFKPYGGEGAANANVRGRPGADDVVPDEVAADSEEETEDETAEAEEPTPEEEEGWELEEVVEEEVVEEEVAEEEDFVEELPPAEVVGEDEVVEDDEEAGVVEEPEDQIPTGEDIRDGVDEPGRGHLRRENMRPMVRPELNLKQQQIRTRLPNVELDGVAPSGQDIAPGDEPLPDEEYEGDYVPPEGEGDYVEDEPLPEDDEFYEDEDY